MDGLGRTTKLTDPNQNVTYTVYNDVAHEVRTYRGRHPSGQPFVRTGPTVVTRDDRTHSPSYTETLTFSKPPDLVGNNPPDGSELIETADLQSLARTYTSPGGQVTSSDVYFSLAGMAYGTGLYLGQLNVNYYTTGYGYDSRGRRNLTVSPTGTISLTAFDGLSRPVATAVGTDFGYLRTVAVNSYDNGGVGDGNLTRHTEYPSGRPPSPNEPADARVTLNFYDWRNRLVVTKGGAKIDAQGVLKTRDEDLDTQRPITYRDLDNLGQVVTEESYDGDLLYVVSSNGVPQQPWKDTDDDGVPDVVAADRLRAKGTGEYDEQGRVFRSHVFSVDQTTGAVSAASLTTDFWYDKRGNLLKTAAPGGLVTKAQYDGAGRPTVTYTGDGFDDSGWADAGDVAGDYVLTQLETKYDGNGNVLLRTSRERFHNETAAGALGDRSTSPKARVSYVASYYDALDRMTAAVDVGTFGGNTYTPPPQAPALSSDMLLLTRYGYLADEVQQVAVVGTPTGGFFTLTFNGDETDPISLDADAAQVQTALQALQSIGQGNALVLGPSLGPWVVRFAGALAETNVAELTANSTGLGGAATAVVATTSQGGDAGRQQKVIDPRGVVAKTDYDLLGRTVRTVGAFRDFAPAGGDDQVTELTYDGSGHVLTRTAWESALAFQRTEYVYGVMTTGGNASDLASNDLLREVRHPDKMSGLPSTGVGYVETFAYNALGQRKAYADRNATRHDYSFDVLGRPTADAVTIPQNSTVDGFILKLETGYDTAGRPARFTSYTYDNTPNGLRVANEVLRVYNGLGQLATEYQDHGGAVDPASSPKVQYGYSAMAGGNHSRPTDLTYPNGRVVSYAYTAGAGAAGLDDRVSRLSAESDAGGTLEQYLYLGLGTVVERTHPKQGAPAVAIGLTYLKQGGEPNGDSQDPYAGLDRFGRVVDQRWLLSNAPTSPTDRFQYGYDRNDNRLYRQNAQGQPLAAAFGELYHASGAVDTYDGNGNLMTTGYDRLNQLKDFGRGVLSASVPGGPLDTVTGGHSQSWDLDALGNWNSVTTDNSTQQRAHNAQNQITEINGASVVAYDDNGNLTTDEQGQGLMYDAWNRLVATTAGAAYAYDALGRRIAEPGTGSATQQGLSAAVPARRALTLRPRRRGLTGSLPFSGSGTLGPVTGGAARDLYYSAGWQVLEEREGAPKAQYVWSPVYVDALVRRDRDANGSSGDGLEEQLYAQQDANFNVTALTDPLGVVKERYVYDPYGKASLLTPEWAEPLTSSPYGWRYLHQGGRFDATAQLYHFRRRDLSPTLGRWIQQDPKGFDAGDSNLYRAESNRPTNALDPRGTELLVYGDDAASFVEHYLEHDGIDYYRKRLPGDYLGVKGGSSLPLYQYIPKGQFSGPTNRVMQDKTASSFEKDVVDALISWTSHRIVYSGEGPNFHHRELEIYGDLTPRQRTEIFENNLKIFGLKLSRNGITRDLPAPDSLKGEWRVTLVVGKEPKKLGGHV